MPDNRSVTDEEKDDSDDISMAGVAKRLTRVTGILQKANVRLDRLTPVLEDPPEPVTPEVRAALTTARAEAAKVVATIDSLAIRVPQ